MGQTHTISGSAIQRILNIPTFLVRPRAILEQTFGAGYKPGDGIKAGAQYLLLGIAVLYAFGLARGFDLSHVSYILVGSAVTWVLYGLFMHVFVRLWGGRQGFVRTIDAYTFTIGILQPTFAFIIFALSYIQPIHNPLEVEQSVLGTSGGAVYVIHFKGLPEDTTMAFHIATSVIIWAYLSLALSVAHAMKLWRGIGAVATSFVFFCVLYLIVFLIGALAGMPIRIFESGGE